MVWVEHVGWCGRPDWCSRYELREGWDDPLHLLLYDLVEDAMKRREGQVADGSGGQPVKPCEIMELCPTLVEWMTDQAWDDGSPRQTSTVLVFWEQGVWKGMLNDRDANKTLWVTARTLFEVLMTLESKLHDPLAEWRQGRDRDGGGQASRTSGGGRSPRR